MLRRLDCIDALRGIALLGVIAVHTSYFTAALPPALNRAASDGRYGVQLFYVISAFTLFLSLSQHTPYDADVVRKYLLRRFFRIAPLFWLAVAGFLLRAALGPRLGIKDAGPFTALNVLATVTFTNGFSAYWIYNIVPGQWSVAVEMPFYLTVPFLWRKISSLLRAVVFTLVALISAMALQWAGNRFALVPDRALWSQFLYFWLPNQLPVFGLGFVLFHLYKRLSPTPSARRKATAGALLAVSLAGWCSLLARNSEPGIVPLHFAYGLVWVALAMSLLLWPFRLVVNNVTAYVGKISYSAYLTHVAVLQVVHRGLIHTVGSHALPAAWEFAATFLATLMATVIVSTATYRCVELPGQNLGRWVIGILEDRRDASHTKAECVPTLEPRPRSHAD